MLIKGSPLFPGACVMNVCAFVLTPGLSWSIDGDLYGSVVCGHLRRVGEYCNCQREALA